MGQVNYYPHHIGDYAKDTAHLSMLEDGAYRRLLDLCYGSEKPLPLDREKLYRLARARSHADKAAVDIVLGEFFIEGDDGWHQRRVEEELAKAQEKSAKASASAAKRWQYEGNANASANAMRTHSEGNAPNNQEPRTNNPIAPSGHFLRFWGAWPKSARKQSRGPCWERWRKADLDLVADLIVAHVEAMKLSIDWRKDGGAFIPAPLVYLNQRRWDGADLQAGDEERRLAV